jgi:EAL domain-containing protein (putative c-di-GMP-specific phosphodiesterase class I)
MSLRKHTVDPSISHPEGRFPLGVVTLVTEVPRIVERLSSAAASVGLPMDDGGGRLVLRVSDDSQDEACLTFGSFLSPLEQERVFLVREGVGGPRVRSLRQVLAACQNSWFSDFLHTGLFAAQLQPIVDLETRTAFGFEAFLRAATRDGTPVSPERAFGAARATGSVPQLDAVARRAAFHASRLHLGSADRLFVKVDRESLVDGIEAFEMTLPPDGKFPLPADHIVLELTEAQAVGLGEGTRDAIAGLRRLGFRVALGELAGGSSTQVLLERLRPDFAKLDRRLVRDAVSDVFRGRIVRAVSELARGLGVILVAEGVEGNEDVRFVRDSGINLAQGHFLAPPAAVPARSFPSFFAAVGAAS